MSAGRQGVALLEAMISLVVIASVAGACLQLRAGAIRQRISVDRAMATDEALDSLMALATAGLLDGEPAGDVSTDDRRVWRGVHLGEPYEVVSDIVEIANPLAGATPDAPPALSMRLYTVAHRGGQAQELRLATP